MARQEPLYSLVADVLKRSILSGSIEKGAVILEGPVADLLGCTRTPVRQALNALADAGLLSRFDGRGYAVGPHGVQPHRITLTRAMLGGQSEANPVRKMPAWGPILHEVERDVVHLSVFGRHRINEIELARHFGVGRTVARDVLLRIESLGLVEKDERLRWTVIPLDETRITHLYELRWLLEPSALRDAMRAGISVDASRMAASLRKTMRAYPKTRAAELDELEHDLHVGLLSRCSNSDLLYSLQRTRCVLTLSKHVLGASAPLPKRDPFMSEHLVVLEAVERGDSSGAEAYLRAHLESSCTKVIDRAKAVRDGFTCPVLPYVEDR